MLAWLQVLIQSFPSDKKSRGKIESEKTLNILSGIRMIEKKRRQKEKKTPEAGCITVLGVTVVLTANVVCGVLIEELKHCTAVSVSYKQTTEEWETSNRLLGVS